VETLCVGAVAGTVMTITRHDSSDQAENSMEKRIRRIGVLTSGGDAPGMNAAIRAVVRGGATRGCEVLGIRDGYAGLLEGRMSPLSSRDVGGILHRGGTVLGSARCPEFITEEGQQRAVEQLREHRVDGVVVIGGNGTQTGSAALARLGVAVVGVASTIDNDLVGADITIGVDSALNTALEAVDRLKTTASSHRRAFLVEVMGRDCGYLALAAGLAGGAEAVVVPEHPTTAADVADQLRAAYARGNDHAVAVVGEGSTPGTDELLAYGRDHQAELGFELRATVLGHVQRGAAPGAFDRLLGSRLGAGAVDQLLAGPHGVLLGLRGREIRPTPLEDVIGRTKSVDPELLELARRLAT
jgi:6-phosphofructokinase 1